MQVISRSTTVRRVAPDKNRSLRNADRATKWLSLSDSDIESFVRTHSFPHSKYDCPEWLTDSKYYFLKLQETVARIFYDRNPYIIYSYLKF